MISRLHKNIGLFCKRAPQKRLYSAKETYNVKESTSHSHLIYCRNLTHTIYIIIYEIYIVVYETTRMLTFEIHEIYIVIYGLSTFSCASRMKFILVS